DESKYALLVSEHLKTDHTNIIFSNKNLTDLIPKLNSIYDEPFADSSQLPTILLSQVTKKDVKVALSGDGGDEIFAGYNRYTWAKNIKLFYSLTPFYLRKIISKLMRLISAENWDKISFLYPKKLSFFGDKVYKLSNVIELKTFNEIYDNLISQWQSNDLPLKDSFVSKRNNFLLNQKNKTDIVKQMQLLDISTYLPDDILTKVDRASMAYSLEVRVPFLNKDLVKYLFSLSYQNNKFRGNKLILKKILSKYIPKNLVYRPKMGFSIPLEKWLKHQLRDWAEDLLEDKKLNDNILDSKKIKKRWNEHLSGKRNWQYSLWTILMYQSWKFSNK
ncbi:MAG: asparagine synthase C-terminal domain-containing protein, partial [Planctomycetota bacterium]|nr:asparagine synthase C-terminal domain-containing protein [Planctomycetota bacterium]